ATRIGNLYPADAGIVIALCLNLLRLEPGDAVYLPAGNLHAYLHGTGIEIMANSDNVLRGGLTPKHVDVPELLKVLDFGAGPVSPLRAEPVGQERTFRTDAPEFRLSYIDVTGSLAFEHQGLPEILLVTQGSVRAANSETELLLASGGSIFVRASDPDYELSGQGRVFRARVGGG
ncbi:MAG TPA: mannose-6-phosphate isomerase, class I, partial [Polyangiaceae bacterium]|nr:mannose-6-phosphate isomerase, class I [Polyangiaceae bacterium]